MLSTSSGRPAPKPKSKAQSNKDGGDDGEPGDENDDDGGDDDDWSIGISKRQFALGKNFPKDIVKGI